MREMADEMEWAGRDEQRRWPDRSESWAMSRSGRIRSGSFQS